ncbi:hypothetical protein [Clostridium porci]|uniref:Uncharacterized protein n=1 Tax=Clostridium porci TaxID=2605778 RepID=A0A7X2NPP0_9CLOT|nr:hypothetical protein [Clostridium porci]MSS38613.1 hypothetical protein [Clostridium porci]
MPFIKNNTEVAGAIKISIENAAVGFSLKTVNLKAAENVEVEKECSTTYATGVKIVEAFKSHLKHASNFVSEVSKKLNEADEMAAISNQLSLDIPFAQDIVPAHLTGFSQLQDQDAEE